MADKRKQVEGVIARMRKVSADAAAVADDLEALLDGADTTGQLVNRLMKAWGAAWSIRNGGRTYVFTARAANAGALKRLLAAGMKAEDIEARMEQYCASRDPFYVTARHAFEVFVKSINKFTGTAEARDDEQFLEAPVRECSHTPRCGSEQEHTRKRAQEMRA